jgi:hypothetical protein
VVWPAGDNKGFMVLFLPAPGQAARHEQSKSSADGDSRQRRISQCDGERDEDSSCDGRSIRMLRVAARRTSESGASRMGALVVMRRTDLRAIKTIKTKKKPPPSSTPITQ